MQLKIRIRLTEPLELPINYNHILQGVIYHAIGEDYPYYAEVIHHGYGNKGYKAFTFSPMKGAFDIVDSPGVLSGLQSKYERKWIKFNGDYIDWEIRSTDPVLITVLKLYFMRNGISLLNRRIDPEHISIRAFEKEVEREKVKIIMWAPLTACSPRDQGRTYYYSPEEFGFYELTKINAVERFRAVTGKEAEKPSFTPVSVRRNDKVITKYEGKIIEAWKGRYELEGQSELLDFLYQTGLGAKNSQGFGLFDILE